MSHHVLPKLESFGFIEKVETLATLEMNHVFEELILEDTAPYPGYYDHYSLPADEADRKPHYLFLIVRNFGIGDEDRFIRMTNAIKRRLKPLGFDACLGQVALYNARETCIRLSVSDYSDVPVLISHYRQQGLETLKHREVKPYSSYIKIKKYFELEKLDNDLFRDLDQPDSYYIRVADAIPWPDFEQITLSIRHSSDYKHFDAAMGALYWKDEMMELVRIYDPHFDMEKLQYLRQKYQQEYLRVLSFK